jgi:hypothetical protein
LGGGLNVPDSNQLGNSSRIRAHSLRLISKMAMVSWTSWRRIQPEVVEGEGTICRRERRSVFLPRQTNTEIPAHLIVEELDFTRHPPLGLGLACSMPVSDLDDLGRDHDSGQVKLALRVLNPLGEEEVDTGNELGRSKAVGAELAKSVVKVSERLAAETVKVSHASFLFAVWFKTYGV